jgi:hypothetical protein
MLSGATFGGTAIADAISASVDEGGSVQDFLSANVPTVQLTAVDRIAATVTITTLKWAAAPAIGATGALVLNLKARAEGKGTTGSDVPSLGDYPVAVCTGRGQGAVIEGSPTYTFTFRCHATAT